MAFNIQFKLGTSLNKLAKPSNYRTIVSAVPEPFTRPAALRESRGATSIDQHADIDMDPAAFINAIPDTLITQAPQHRTRVTTNTDYHDVINLCAPSTGRENLRMLFQECMKDRKVMSHVHYVDREFAGFTAIQLVDNGETALWRHARIRSPFCEAGVFGDIMRQLLMKMAKCYPKVTSQVFASTDDVSRYIQEIPVFREGGKKEVLNRKIVSRRFQAADFKPLPRPPSPITVHEMRQNDVMNMSFNPYVMSKLFPGGKIFAHSMNLKLIEENIPELVNNVNADMFATTRRDPDKSMHHLLQDRALSDTQIGNIDMVSTSLYNHMDNHLLYEVDIASGSYPLSEADIDSAKAHIQHHVVRLQELVNDSGAENLVLTITAGINIPETIIDCSLDASGLTKSTDVTDDVSQESSFVKFYEMQNLDSFLKSGDSYDALTSQWKSQWSKRGGDSGFLQPPSVITRPLV